MPHGFFTIEQWRNRKWVTVCHLDACHSLTGALDELQRRNKAGFFRVYRIQRMIWAEKIDVKLRLRKWHAGCPQDLLRTANTFDRNRGKHRVKTR